MSVRTLLAVTGAVALVGLMFAACTPPSAQPYVPSEAGVIAARQSTPAGTTFVLAGGQQFTNDEGVRWRNGMGSEGTCCSRGRRRLAGRRPSSGPPRGLVG